MTVRSVLLSTGTINYELIFSRRKTLGIVVHKDQSVTVRAPQGLSLPEIEKVVRQKSSWINKKQRQFAARPPTPPPPEYTSGATHRYLGRRYRLQVIEDSNEGVALRHGRFFLRVRDQNAQPRKEKLLENWYRQRAKIIFPQRLAAVYPRAARFGIPFPQLKIRKMKSRWGSCSTNGSILLNLKLIQAPKASIDYVILHELAHLKEHNHSPAYYHLLSKLQPDWQSQRDHLNQLPIPQ
jgi:predicted metal-dependent hydrolase